MEPTVEEEFGDLPELAVQTQLRLKDDVGCQKIAEQPGSLHHIRPHKTIYCVAICQALQHLLEPLAGARRLEVGTVVVVRYDSALLIDQPRLRIREDHGALPIQDLHA